MSFASTYQPTLRYNILAEGESLFAFGSASDAERIRRGRRDPSCMTGQEHHAFVGSTWRLIALGDGDKRPIPDIAYEGFMWCGHAELYSTQPIEEYSIPGVFRSVRDENFLFELNPKTMDSVYVADQQTFEDTREAMWQNRPSPLHPHRVSDAEMKPVYSARARTIVPIAEYNGSYEQPIILVKWDSLSYDEIQLVSGPWETKALHNRRRVLPSSSI